MSTVSADQYLAVVESELTDLPWRARKSLLADLRVHLDEIPPDEDLEERLGSPWNYATELRAAADLAPRRGPIAFLRARRPRNVAIAAVLLLAAIALVAVAVWARGYQPLSPGSTSLFPNPSVHGAAEETVAVLRQGKPFQLGYSIRNDGRFSVRIVGVPLWNGFNPFKVRALFLGPADQAGTGPTERFHPFTLRPGGERLIILRGAYFNCDKYAPGGASIFDSMPVRMRFLLWTRTVYIPLQGPLIIKNSRRDSCRVEP